ncbi:MAG: EthD domain-containing protein [Desulfobacterales bacterium]|jgi:uncharacterized protein (TIGR02118 family)|nr:EthD domain-containing protein [Desulfobacterales bacterium]MCK5205441.1 EthD domain-containing protein [Desulfobacterales bacterium]
MIKSLTFLKRKPGLSREKFLRYWKEKHGPLAAKSVPGLKKYVQCHPVPGFQSDIDGIVELWWDSPESFQAFLAWRQSDEAKVLKEDEEQFVDTSRWVRFVAQEHLIIEK